MRIESREILVQRCVGAAAVLGFVVTGVHTLVTATAVHGPSDVTDTTVTRGAAAMTFGAAHLLMAAGIALIVTWPEGAAARQRFVTAGFLTCAAALAGYLVGAIQGF